MRYLGSARSGMREDWLMRVTSVALVPLTIAFVWLLLSLLAKDYNGVRAELGQPDSGDHDAAVCRGRHLSHAARHALDHRSITSTATRANGR